MLVQNIVVGVSVLQLDSAIVDFKTITLLGGDGITHTEISIAIRVFEFY